MRLPVMPPVSPMLGKAGALPEGDGWSFEPKWDGFRCVVFRDGDEVELGSRNERPFNRYFPEVVDAVLHALPERCVVDGELVVPTTGERPGLDFDALQQRIHPAASRVRRLMAETPAHFIAFDLLALDERDLRALPFAERRRLLEQALGRGTDRVHLTPCSTDRTVAQGWFSTFEGAGLDGVMAKRLDSPYREGERSMVKVKHVRTADCVVAGFRWHKDAKGVGSMLLGLYDDQGQLHHVGVVASFTAKMRAQLVDELAPLRDGAIEGHPWQAWAEMQAHESGGRMPGAPSRWNAQKDLSWEPLRVERVCEVHFDQLQSGRFRRVAAFIRWRPDKRPTDCRYDQLEVAPPLAIHEVLDARPDGP